MTNFLFVRLDDLRPTPWSTMVLVATLRAREKVRLTAEKTGKTSVQNY